MKFIKKFIFLSVFSVFLGLIIIIRPVFGSVQEEISDRQKQIDELQKQIDEYQIQIGNYGSQAKTLQNEVNKLNTQIRQLTLSIKALELSINQTNSEILTTEGEISEAEFLMGKHKNALARFLKLAYEADQQTLTEILLNNENLSDFFNSLNNLRVNQENLQITIDSLKKTKSDLETYQNNLEDQKINYEKVRNLEALEKSNLDQNKKSVDKLLKDTKGEETRYQNLVKKSQQNIEALRAQITYLELSGITAEEAVKYGQLAAIATGIRPAYLIAVLEVESGLGRNVGKCNRPEDPPERGYRNIMKPDRDIEPFLKITAELGLNPESTAVSCPQYVNGRRYGWGGAMGPAQFIPSIWMGYRDEVSRIVGRLANPWNIEDAFTAAAFKLARGGANAQTVAAEIAASKAYYSGNSRCSTAPCNSYANAIQRKAAEIEKNL